MYATCECTCVRLKLNVCIQNKTVLFTCSLWFLLKTINKKLSANNIPMKLMEAEWNEHKDCQHIGKGYSSTTGDKFEKSFTHTHQSAGIYRFSHQYQDQKAEERKSLHHTSVGIVRYLRVGSRRGKNTQKVHMRSSRGIFTRRRFMELQTKHYVGGKKASFATTVLGDCNKEKNTSWK